MKNLILTLLIFVSCLQLSAFADVEVYFNGELTDRRSFEVGDEIEFRVEGSRISADIRRKYSVRNITRFKEFRSEGNRFFHKFTSIESTANEIEFSFYYYKNDEEKLTQLSFDPPQEQDLTVHPKVEGYEMLVNGKPFAIPEDPGERPILYLGDQVELSLDVSSTSNNLSYSLSFEEMGSFQPTFFDAEFQSEPTFVQDIKEDHLGKTAFSINVCVKDEGDSFMLEDIGCDAAPYIGTVIVKKSPEDQLADITGFEIYRNSEKVDITEVLYSDHLTVKVLTKENPSEIEFSSDTLERSKVDQLHPYQLSNSFDITIPETSDYHSVRFDFFARRVRGYLPQYINQSESHSGIEFPVKANQERFDNRELSVIQISSGPDEQESIDLLLEFCGTEYIRNQLSNYLSRNGDTSSIIALTVSDDKCNMGGFFERTSPTSFGLDNIKLRADGRIVKLPPHIKTAQQLIDFLN